MPKSLIAEIGFGAPEEKEDEDEGEEKSLEQHALENAANDLMSAFRGDDKGEFIKAFKLFMELCHNSEDSDEE